LESGGGPGSGEKMAQEQEQEPESAQVINEVSPEDEEGDSQELVNSRIQQNSSNM